MQFRFRKFLSYFWPDLVYNREEHHVRMLLAEVTNENKVLSTLERTILLPLNFWRIFFCGISMTQDWYSFRFFGVVFEKMVQEIIWSDKKVTPYYSLFLVLSEDCFLVVERLIQWYNKLFRVGWIFGLSPPFESHCTVHFQNSWTLIPLIVHIGWVHFLHFEVVENGNIGLYLGGGKTGADSFCCDWN